MSLLDLYLEKNQSKEWQNKLLDDSENLFLFDFNENFRELLKFEHGFVTFKNMNEMKDDEYRKYLSDNAQTVKSFINNMTRVKMFYSKGNKRVLTAKGEVYERFLSERLSPSDKWFINYLFISDGYFALKSNYLFERSEEIISLIEKAGYKLGQIYNALIYMFNMRDHSIEEYLRCEYVIMLACGFDTEFLQVYRESSEFEKNELHEYISDNYSKGRYNCLITAKFAPHALNDADTLLDNAKILFFSHYLKNSHPISLEDMLDIFEQVYTRFFKINSKRVTNFVMMYEDVFRMIYLNLFSDMQDFYSGLKYDDKLLTQATEVNSQTLDEIQSSRIDYTTTDAIDQLVKINSVLSMHAKQVNDFKCALHDEYSCKYFTSQTSGKNYLEIHQIIPRDYACEFASSIETPSNYVALCPHCHRLIHSAIDKQRFDALAKIYATRKEALEADGITPSNELLLAIYGIQQSKLDAGDSFNKPLLSPSQPKLAIGKGSKKKATKTK